MCILIYMDFNNNLINSCILVKKKISYFENVFSEELFKIWQVQIESFSLLLIIHYKNVLQYVLILKNMFFTILNYFILSNLMANL